MAGERARPTGRRPGDSGTRDAIRDAALRLFAEHGYDGASVRAIAAAADVDPALVRHFYGDKESLFATVVADQTGIAPVLAQAAAADGATAGREFADAYLGLWERPLVRPILLALVRSATTSPRAAHMLREMLGARVREASGGDPERARRLTLAGASLLGIAVARHVVGVGPIADLAYDDLVDQVAPAVQQYLTGD
ncbi:TetR/AcrR family transcriptional regulator [Cellulomonas sp. S1-8]|uniref:TetR/AcrR family transcriptional regulator n=1 Tax=Cellulomonas sp. S1-8 TaxID=2904790 RepID=UPI0022432842|nr:TetR family transcriptional regulator [Cellulomonas sp. S1-8]UZN03652.1 TetR family transcriptional regulator [Cellulomonas sp. S1-8]